ncbi:MAG: hypothetical protein M0Q95_10775 [Porticoccaceae bacterium]|nr:hypothetical protein [Porticoccaceae bacterium]
MFPIATCEKNYEDKSTFRITPVMKNLRKNFLSSPWNLLIKILLFATPQLTLAYETGDILLRLGYANIDPREKIDTIILNDNINLGGLSIESQQTPLATTTVFLNKHWGIEILLPLADLKIDVNGQGGSLAGLSIGSTDARPLSVLVQYYFFDDSDHSASLLGIKPYIGIGINYTRLSNVRINSNTANQLNIDTIETLTVKDAYGMAFQAGADIAITDKLSLNFSTSFLDIDTEAWTQLRSDGELFEGSTALHLRKNPNVSVLGISYRL